LVNESSSVSGYLAGGGPETAVDVVIVEEDEVVVVVVPGAFVALCLC